jgi:hypothetical protein
MKRRIEAKKKVQERNTSQRRIEKHSRNLKNKAQQFLRVRTSVVAAVDATAVHVVPVLAVVVGDSKVAAVLDILERK